MTKSELAKAYFMEGYNCAQAVTLAFAEEMGLEKDKAARLASSFGGGLGRLREVCGCVSGMALAAGAICGYADPKAREEKAEHYARIQRLAGDFRGKTGSIICRELLAGVGRSDSSENGGVSAADVGQDTSPVPEERTESYYKKRPCSELVALAAEILERELKQEQEQEPVKKEAGH